MSSDDDSPPPITDVAAEVNLPAAKVSALLRVATEPLSMEGYAPRCEAVSVHACRKTVEENLFHLLVEAVHAEQTV